MGFPRQEYWSGLPFPFPGDLPHPGIELVSPAWQADSLLSEPPGKTGDIRVGSLSLLQGELSDPGIEPVPLALQQVFYPLSYQGSPGYSP